MLSEARMVRKLIERRNREKRSFVALMKSDGFWFAVDYKLEAFWGAVELWAGRAIGIAGVLALAAGLVVLASWAARFISEVLP